MKRLLFNAEEREQILDHDTLKGDILRLKHAWLGFIKAIKKALPHSDRKNHGTADTDARK